MSRTQIKSFTPLLNSRKNNHVLRVPGDKSISHRALLFGGLAQGSTQIWNLLEAEDVKSTASCLKNLGVKIIRNSSSWFVQGVGIDGLQPPKSKLNCGNSGTTLRLLMGVLASQSFETELFGDLSLSKRPMKRISDPLVKMGAQIHLTHGQTAPVQINRPHRPLQAIDYALPIASAQLKSAILLAGLSAEGTTRLLGQIKSRDHTERLLAHFGVRVNQSLNQEGFCESISIQGGQKLEGTEIKVPGDISSAAFWLGLGAMIPCGTIEIHDVLLNPTRTGIIRLLQRMGTSIQFKITSSEPEPSGWIKIEKSDLRGVEIEPSEVPFLIDEIPLIAVLAALAKGTTIVRGAEELRVKETDRLEAVAKNLRAMGGRIELLPDGFIIEGPQSLQGARLESFGDHRIAMAFSIAALAAKGLTEIQESDCVSISYPEFYETLNSVLSQSSSSGDITILDS